MAATGNSDFDNVFDRYGKAAKQSERAEAICRFNRFYARQMEVLHQHVVASQFSLTEDRVLYELAHRTNVTAADLRREMGLNAGYMSRVIGGLEEKGMVSRSRTAPDARVAWLELTEKGREAFRPVSEASHREVEALLAKFTEPEQHELVDAMAQIQSYLSTTPPGYVVREPQPGDLAWAVYRNGAVYTREYGWDSEFEAMVADTVSRYVRESDAASSRCWIAEKNGKPVGSVFVVRDNADTARMCLLYVDASARGIGIGRSLVEEAQRFSAMAGYKRLVVSTSDEVTVRHRIFAMTGFRKTEQGRSIMFGRDILVQTWSMEL